MNIPQTVAILLQLLGVSKSTHLGNYFDTTAHILAELPHTQMLCKYLVHHGFLEYRGRIFLYGKDADWYTLTKKAVKYVNKYEVAYKSQIAQI